MEAYLYDWANISLVGKSKCQAVCDTLDIKIMGVQDKTCVAEGCGEAVGAVDYRLGLTL